MPRGKKKSKAEESISVRKERFLDAYRRTGFRTRALEEADIAWRTLKKWLMEDTAFAQDVEEVIEEVEATWRDDLEEVGLRRAMSRDSGLLKFFLAKIDPSYRETARSVAGGVQVIMKENIDLGEL